MDDSNQKLIEQLIKVVDSISATLSENQKRFENFATANEKHAEALLKEGNSHYALLEKEAHNRYENITREIQKQHEALSREGHERYERLMLDMQKRTEAMSHDIQKREDEIREENKKTHASETKRMRWDAFIIVFISTFSICISILFTNFWDLQGKKIDLRRVELTHSYNQEQMYQNRIAYLQNQIDYQFKIRNQLMDAMVVMRGIRDIGQKQCRNGHYIGKDPIAYEQKLFSASYALVGAYYKTIGVFNDNVKQGILKFNAMSSADDGAVCAKNAVTEKELRPLQAEIDGQILITIEALVKQKNKLVNTFSREVDQKNR